MEHSKKVILISGGSRGLGKALVDHFLKNGDIVTTFSRSQTSFIKECQKNKSSDSNFYWESIGSTEYEKVKKFAMKVTKRYKRIDALINNVGVNLDQVLPLSRLSDIHRVISINVESVIYLSQIVSRIMLQQNSGNIINISSILGIRGFKGVSVYSSTKAALDGFTRSLARELGPRGIRVNSVVPGYFKTDMTRYMAEEEQSKIIHSTPLKRLGKVEDVVGVVKFLLSPEAEYITGQSIVVDGGLTC